MANIQYIPYRDLIRKYKIHHGIPYDELLLTTEWKNKRDHIVNRDNKCCKNCNQKATYISDGAPGINWQEKIDRFPEDYSYIKKLKK